MQKIDSHQHFWVLERGDYAWLTPETETLYKDFSPEDYIDVSRESDTIQTILVQAADTEAETNYLLELAAKHRFIAGVVGWINFESPKVIEHLGLFAANQLFKGVRPMLQDISDHSWILQAKFNEVFTFLSSNNLTFDALVKTEHLEAISIIALRHPELRIVIDHCAKPDIKNSQFSDWSIELSRFKELKNVSVKLSGLTTEAGTGQKSPAVFSQYFKCVFNVFGHGRVMWGSDWPVVNVNASYKDWINLCEILTEDFEPHQKAQFWFGCARQFYNIKSTN